MRQPNRKDETMNMTNDQKNALLANLDFAVEHLVEVSPPSLSRLTTTLEDFESIDPALAILNGSGGYDFSIVTDGTYFVLVNAEGYNYPRYRGPRIALELLANIQKPGADQLCVRKSFWQDGFTVETPEQLNDAVSAPYQYTY